MTWRKLDVRIEKLWRALAGVQLLLAIIVFIWYGWEEKKLNAESQKLSTQIQEKDIALRQAQTEALVSAISDQKVRWLFDWRRGS